MYDVSVVTAVVSDMAVVTVKVSIVTMGSVVVANTVTTVRVGGNIALLVPGGSDGNESSSSESLEHSEITIVFGRSGRQLLINAFENRDSWELTVRPC